MKQRKKKDGCQIIWVTVETCTTVITLFTTENLMHRSVMSSQPMACDLKLSYSLTGLNSRQKKAGGVPLDGNKASSHCYFSLYSFAVKCNSLCVSVKCM